MKTFILFILFFFFSSYCFPGEIQVKLLIPKDGIVLDQSSNIVSILGRIFTKGISSPKLDMALVLDTSGSTANPSGVDVDGDGIVGVQEMMLTPGGAIEIPGSTDPDDSVLAAEVVASEKLLDQLDPSRTKLSIITFAGDIKTRRGINTEIKLQSIPETPDAFVELPLSNDFSKAREVLKDIKSRKPDGGTNMAAGLRKAIEELAGLNKKDETYDRERRKIILFLTDGMATFPVGSPNVTDEEDMALAISAAKIGSIIDIHVNTYGIGPYALLSPFILAEIARVTNGFFTPVSNPGDIIAVLPRTNLLDIDSVQVKNVTLGKPSVSLTLGKDGYFLALVPVATGANTIEATAFTTDNAMDKDAITLHIKVDKEEKDLQLEMVKKRMEELELEMESMAQTQGSKGLKKTPTPSSGRDLELTTKGDKEKKEEKLKLELEVKDKEGN